MTDAAYIKLCVRTADMNAPVVPSIKRRCLMCGNWCWSDPRADIPQMGTALIICEHCIPDVIENHLAEGDISECP